MEMIPHHPGSIALPPIGNANTRPLRKSHVLVAALLTVVFLLLALIMALHAYIAWVLARPPILPLTSNPRLAFGADYQNVQFASANGKTELEGWYIPSERPSETTVVFSHGYGGNREEIWVPLLELAQAAYLQHYNVLMFDYGFVKPERVVTGGVQETQELLGAIRYAKNQGAREVIVWGFSMGAGTALQAALRTGDITAMILDSTFLLNPDTLYHNIRQHIDLPKNPSVPLIRLFFPLLNGVSLKQIPYRTVEEADFQIPIFFIHGKNDSKAPYDMAQKLAANQKNNKLSSLWLLPRDKHELIYRARKQDYLDRTLSFINLALKH